MLTRKPRVGEVLVYKCYDISREYKVTRFDERFPNIAHVEEMESGEHTLFIWKTSNCLNIMFSHKEDSDAN